MARAEAERRADYVLDEIVAMLSHLLGGDEARLAQVVRVVVAQKDAVEEQGHDARELHRLREGVAEVAEEEEEGGLEARVLVELTDEERRQRV